MFRAEQIVDIEDVIVILVVVSIIVHWLARLGENASWVASRLIVELRVANVICITNVRRELAERL